MFHAYSSRREAPASSVCRHFCCLLPAAMLPRQDRLWPAGIISPKTNLFFYKSPCSCVYDNAGKVINTSEKTTITIPSSMFCGHGKQAFQQPAPVHPSDWQIKALCSLTNPLAYPTMLFIKLWYALRKDIMIKSCHGSDWLRLPGQATGSFFQHVNGRQKLRMLQEQVTCLPTWPFLLLGCLTS